MGAVYGSRAAARRRPVRAWAFAVMAAVLICTTAAPSGYVVAASASLSGSAFLENSIIPAEGSLFKPDSQTTRGTVAVALYNLSAAEATQVAGARDPLSGASGPAANGGFFDVPKDSPYYAATSFCASKGYVNGYPDGTFKPGELITRAEMCEVLGRFLSLKADARAPMPPDVTTGHWASGSISAVIANGIMAGYADKTFRPENNLTRAELATIIVHAKQLPQPSYIRGFADVPKTHWAYKDVARVSAPPIPEPTPTEAEVARLINEARAKAGAEWLSIDPILCEIAHIKARDMIDYGYFDHKSPNWGTPDEMMDHLGVDFMYLGENIGYGAKTAAEVVGLWIDSPGHYANLIMKEYTKTGVACVTNEKGAAYWVQIFSS